jgi:glycine reductase
MAERTVQLDGKRLIILGERDGVPAPVIEQAIAGLGGEIAYAATQCFV